METATLPISISRIEFFPKRPERGHIGFISWVITISNRLQFAVSNVAVYTRLSGDGLRLVYPNKRLPSGLELPSFQPLDRESAEAIERPVLNYLESLFSKQSNQNVNTTPTKCGDAHVNNTRVP